MKTHGPTLAATKRISNTSKLAAFSTASSVRSAFEASDTFPLFLTGLVDLLRKVGFSFPVSIPPLELENDEILCSAYCCLRPLEHKLLLVC
jgi:hypothetical protein